MGTIDRFQLLLLALLAMIWSACSTDRPDNPTEYVAFQETPRGRWGLVSLDGHVLFSERYKNEPTCVRDDRFFVKNDSGLWDMYEASQHPRKIGRSYVYTSGFSHGHALVVEPNQPISLIDTEGKVIKRLERIAGKSVQEVTAFDQGIAIFQTTDSLYGAIDENGACVLPSKFYYLVYDSEKFWGIPEKYKPIIEQADKRPLYMLHIMDASGKTLREVSSHKFDNLITSSDKYAIGFEKAGKKTWTFYNLSGEVIYRCPAKVETIKDIKGDTFIFSNGEGWGVMNLHGETLIRAQYDDLQFDGNWLIATTQGENNGRKGWIDTHGRTVGSDNYDLVHGAARLDGTHALVKINEKSFSIADAQGHLLEKLPDMVGVGVKTGDEMLENDRIDMAQFLKKLRFSAEGVDGFSFQTTPLAAVQRMIDKGEIIDEEGMSMTSPGWYDETQELSFTTETLGINVNVNVTFYDRLSKEKTRRHLRTPETDAYYDPELGGGASDNYVWNSTRPRSFWLSIDNDFKMHGKLRSLFDAIVARLLQEGRIIKGNNGAKIFALRNGCRALVALKPRSVFVFWGDLPPLSDQNIKHYENNKEDLTSANPDANYGMSDEDAEAADDLPV